MTHANHDQAFTASSVQTLRRIKLSALGLSALALAGIGGLMVLSAGKGEDITGIVAPALLIALLSGMVAVVATVMQKRREKGR
jgi:drug/metabolite transporter (DMT)-like permease